MIDRFLRYAYRKLGRFYPPIAVALQFSVAHFVVLAGIGLLMLYQDMSAGDFWRIVCVTQILMLVENVFSTKLALCMMSPLRRWYRGDRGEAETVEAWQALAGLPYEHPRRWRLWAVFLNLAPVSAYIAIELELPWVSGLIIFVGAVLVLLYGLTLRYFLLEMVLRPVLEHVSRSLPDGFELPKGVPLRWKLLAALPIINIITGVTVSGLSTDDTTQLADLGLDVAIAVAVAFSISLELTLLLSRSLLTPIDELRSATDRVAAGDLSVRVPVVSADETGRLAQSFNEMAAGLAEREKLRQAFGTFVDPNVAERILSEGELLEGDELEVSLLFLDIRGFTSLAERLSAREVVGLLNEFYERVVPVLAAHGGHADKFIGDGLLGVFGAPERRDDHADCAVAAAVAIADVVHDAYGDELRVGIGVNSGPVVAGTIGGGGRLDFTVIGDAVNTAARVEAATRETGDEILITEATRCLLTHDHGVLEERPPVDLRGKSELVRLYAPVRRAAPAAVAGADEAPREEPSDTSAAARRDPVAAEARGGRP